VDLSGLHIGMVSWDYDPPIGGMGRHVKNLVTGLRSRGLNVSVLSGKDIKTFRCRNLGFSLTLKFRLRKWIKQNLIDVLHVHTGPGGVLLFDAAGIPTVVTANHTYSRQSRLPGENWKRSLIPFERITYACADRVISISSDTAAAVGADYGIPREKISVIPCGFPLELWAGSDLEPDMRKLSVVFIGRPDKRKGWDILMSAWPKVLVSNPDAVLEVVGFDAGPVPGIRYLGKITDESLRKIVGESRLTVCPSRLEGFGLSAAQSIAAGTPVVASNVAGLRTTVKNWETGLLTKAEPETLAAAIRLALSDEMLWERLHAGCRADRERFDDEGEIKSYIEIYNSIV